MANIKTALLATEYEVEFHVKWSVSNSVLPSYYLTFFCLGSFIFNNIN